MQDVGEYDTIFKITVGSKTETTEKNIWTSVFFSSFGNQLNDMKKENNMFKKFEMELAGRTLRVDVGRVAHRRTVQRLCTMEKQLYCQLQQHQKNQERELISFRSV